MKNYKDIAESVLRRRDEELQKTNIRRRRVRQISALCGAVAVAATVSLAIWHSDAGKDLTESPIIKGDEVISDTEIVADKDIYPEIGDTEEIYVESDAHYNDDEVGLPAHGDDGEPPVQGGIGFGNWPVKYMPEDKVDDQVRHLTWEEMTLCQRYPDFSFDGRDYTVRTASQESVVTEEMLEEKLGVVELWGYDVYRKEEHITEATVYRLSAILPECAVAISFDEGKEGQFFVYTNSYYRPETLGDFIDAIDFKSHIDFGDIWYYYTDDDGLHTIKFTPVEDRVIWERLLASRDIPNVHDYWSTYNASMSITVDVPILGFYGVSLSVTEAGYMYTNIMDTVKAFYVGEDVTQMFMEYVCATCEGVEIVYVSDEITGCEGPYDDGVVTAVSEGVSVDPPEDSIVPTTTPAEPYIPNDTVVAVTSGGYDPGIVPPDTMPTVPEYPTTTEWDQPKEGIPMPEDVVSCDVETSPYDTEIALETELICG